MLWILLSTLHNTGELQSYDTHISFRIVHLLHIMIYRELLQYEYFSVVFSCIHSCSIVQYAIVCKSQRRQLFREIFVLEYRKHVRTSFQSVMSFSMRLCDKYLKSNSCFCQLYLYFVAGVTFATLTPVYISLFIMAIPLGFVLHRTKRKRTRKRCGYVYG